MPHGQDIAVIWEYVCAVEETKLPRHRLLKAQAKTRIQLSICHTTELPTACNDNGWMLSPIVNEYISRGKLNDRHFRRVLTLASHPQPGLKHAGGIFT